MGIDVYVATGKMDDNYRRWAKAEGARGLMEIRLTPDKFQITPLPEDKRFPMITKGLAYWLVGDDEQPWAPYSRRPLVSENVARNVMDLTNWPEGWDGDAMFSITTVSRLRQYDRATPPKEGMNVVYERKFEEQLDPILAYADEIDARWLFFMFRDTAMVSR